MTAITALADVDICNMALSHLGISQQIQSISPPDQSPQAAACAFWYPKMRNWLLRSAPWNFAYLSQALASDATVFPGWAYAYQYPNDCLQAVAVTTSAGLRFGNSYWNNWWSQGPFNGAIPKIPFKVVQSQAVAGQQAILCDLPPSSPVYLFYIQCVTNTALFDSMFSDALALYLASRVGGPLRADLNRVKMAAAGAEGMRLQALAQTMNEAQQDLERVSPSISARW
jgi:hypothetical protein